MRDCFLLALMLANVEIKIMEGNVYTNPTHAAAARPARTVVSSEFNVIAECIPDAPPSAPSSGYRETLTILFRHWFSETRRAS